MVTAAQQRKLDRLPNLFETLPLEKHLESLEMGPFDRGRRPRDHLYASELGSCPKAVWLGFNRPKPIDKEFSDHRGALGHCVEDGMAVKLARLLVAREVSFRNDKVSGRVDFVIRMEHGGPQIPVELKTTYAYPRAVDFPEMSHLLQLGWYLTQMPEAPFGILILYSLAYPTSGYWSAVQVPRDDDFVAEHVERLWRIIHKAEEPVCREPGLDDRGKPACFGCARYAGALEGPT